MLSIYHGQSLTFLTKVIVAEIKYKNIHILMPTFSTQTMAVVFGQLCVPVIMWLVCIVYRCKLTLQGTT